MEQKALGIGAGVDRCMKTSEIRRKLQHRKNDKSLMLPEEIGLSFGLRLVSYVWRLGLMEDGFRADRRQNVAHTVKNLD